MLMSHRRRRILLQLQQSLLPLRLGCCLLILQRLRMTTTSHSLDLDCDDQQTHSCMQPS